MIYRFSDLHGYKLRDSLLKREEVQSDLFALICKLIIELQNNNLTWVSKLRL